MKRKLHYAVALIALTTLFGCQSLVLKVMSIRPFVEDRFQGWVNMGIPEEELDSTLRKISDPKGEGPGSWVLELSKVAGKYESKALSMENSGGEAHENWKKAAIYYYIARFPFVGSTAKQIAYEKHIKAYLNYARSFDPPLEIVEIPFEGKKVVGYLRIPTVESPPVVVVTGGVDTWKSDVDVMIEPLLKQGLAVFAFDMPGTGESEWNLSPENEKVYTAVFDYLKKEQRLDGNRIGLYEMSFGGYYSIRMALSNPDVDAAINVGGPVSLSFSKDNIKKVPDVMVATIAHAMGVNQEYSIEKLAELVKPFDLDKPGFLKSPKYNPFILSINGAKDELVPIEDLYIISKRGVKQEEWVYPESGHCALELADQWADKAAIWMKEKLQ